MAVDLNNPNNYTDAEIREAIELQLLIAVQVAEKRLGRKLTSEERAVVINEKKGQLRAQYGALPGLEEEDGGDGSGTRGG
ncbi:MAG TPA: hypothetical protein VKU00_12200 [Chthonomonadaceae bacterium]|nr:hypothetical protein [Chthonomonadaceae bacterium]